MRRRVYRWWMPIVLLATSCTPDFDKVWQVKDLRILAIRAEPPEVIQPEGTTFPAVHVDALVVDPLAPPDALFDWKLYACTAEEVRCDAAQRQVLVKEGRSRLDQIAVDLVLDAASYQAAKDADPLQGFGGVPVMVELQVSRDGYSARGIKRLVYGRPVPAEKTPNANPVINQVTVDQVVVPQPWTVTIGQKVKLLPSPTATAKEKYWVATFTGGKRELEEYLSYSFFTTAGELSDATTGGKPIPFVTNAKIDDLSSDWTPKALPEGIDSAVIWIVVHDDRGGVGWVALPAGLAPGP
jgi:hypothetical protein